MSIFCIICLDNQSNNTEIHLVADKHQLSQINLEVSHLIDVFQRFGFTGESLTPVSVHVSTINLKLSNIRSFYDYREPRNDFYIRFQNISLTNDTVCLTTEVDPAFTKYMVSLFGATFGVDIPTFPLIKLSKRKWAPLTFMDLDTFLLKYRPALTDMTITCSGLLLKGIGWLDKSFTLYPLNGTLFILSESEIKAARRIKNITKNDLVRITDNEPEEESDRIGNITFRVGGATPHSISVSQAEVDDMERVFDRFRLWYNRTARRLDFSDIDTNPTGDDTSLGDILRTDAVTQTPGIESVPQRAQPQLLSRGNNDTETQTPGLVHSRLNAQATPWLRQSTQPPTPNMDNNSKNQGKHDLLTFVAQVHRVDSSESNSVNESLDLLTGDELTH